MKADDAGLRSASDTSKSSVLFVWFLFFWVHQTVALRWCCADVIREVGGTNALSWRCVCWPVDLCVFPETDTQESTDRKLQTWRRDGVRCENVALVGSTQILLTVARCVEARVTSHPVWLDWSREGVCVCVCVAPLWLADTLVDILCSSSVIGWDVSDAAEKTNAEIKIIFTKSFCSASFLSLDWWSIEWCLRSTVLPVKLSH